MYRTRETTDNQPNGKIYPTRTFLKIEEILNVMNPLITINGKSQ